MTAGISREEWLAALEEANAATDQSDPNWLSIYEYAALIGCHYNKARRDLKRLVSVGMADQQLRRRRTDDGALRPVMCYRLLKKANGKKR